MVFGLFEQDVEFYASLSSTGFGCMIVVVTHVYGLCVSMSPILGFTIH